MLKFEVAKAWDELQGDIELLGEQHTTTLRTRAKWYGLDKAWRIMFPGESY